MKSTTEEVRAITQADTATPAEREAATKLANGTAKIVCGAIIEANDPTNGLNRQVNCDAIHRLAVEIQRKRDGR